MRISDWSSDVCSSDLGLMAGFPRGPAPRRSMPEQLVDLRHELAQGKGLGEDLRAGADQVAGLPGILRKTGDEHDADTRAQPARRPGEPDAVQPGQPDIGQKQVEPGTAEQTARDRKGGGGGKRE